MLLWPHLVPEKVLCVFQVALQSVHCLPLLPGQHIRAHPSSHGGVDSTIHMVGEESSQHVLQLLLHLLHAGLAFPL